MTTLIVAVGTYTALNQPAFLTQYNIENLLLQTMPIALVSIGQTNALLVGGFDVSVAALMTLCVVTASYTMKPGLVLAAPARGRPRAHRRRPGHGRLQRDARPRPPPPVDHRHARDVQHPRGAGAPAARPPGGADQPRRHQRAHEERRLRAARLHRRRRARRSAVTSGCTAHARGSPSGRWASTRRPRAGSGCPPGGSSSARSSSAP